MPVCPRCDTAYLDDESHKCEPRNRLGEALGIVFGTLLGALAGFCLDFLPQNGGTLAAIFTVPIGAVLGAVMGYRAAARQHDE
jgi:hypothetical protein